ncbi:MAG: molybdenum cofactor guanylyltransferase, partial [Candidatus Omnitrophota bacterium]
MLAKNIAGVILAGGKNTRMGTHKAFLRVDGVRIIDRILEVFKPLFDEILIVTDNKDNFTEFKDVKVVDDLVRERGPLGGIYTGLKMIAGGKAFFSACDMPFLHNGLVERLLVMAQDE